MNAPPIYINTFMFTRIIRDPASPTEKLVFFSEAFFFLLVKKYVLLVSRRIRLKFTVSENGWSPHRGEGRGEQSSLAFKGT